MARIVFNPGWKDELAPDISEFLGDIAQEVLGDMQRYVPKDTGRLLNDLDYEVQGFTARVGAKTVDYAYYVEVGTRPHVITPNGKNALDWPGSKHPSGSVNHPGSAPSNYMRKALYKSRGGI